MKLFAIRSDHYTALRFGLLLPSHCGPPAVRWFVIPVVVDAVDREIVCITIGPSPIAKDFEMVPFCANANAASPIVAKCIRFGSRATSLHTGPNPVQPCFAFSMRALGLNRALEPQASTRLCSAAFQLVTSYCYFIATSALAMPKAVSAITASKLKYGQSTKCLASDIFESGQGNLLERLLGQVMGWRSNAGPLRIVAHGIPQ